MGEYFMYANLDRHEYFMIDALGGATKASGIGRNMGARALGLLLTPRNHKGDAPTVIGSWAGTRVAVIGDHAEPNILGIPTSTAEDPQRNLYALAKERYTNIASKLALMLLHHDEGDNLIQAARTDDSLFVLLAELAVVHRVKAVESLLSQHFNQGWLKEYAEKRKKVWVAIPPP
jgi:hypothetical protein